MSKADFENRIKLFTLTNKSKELEVNITNFGGRIVSLIVPDKNKNATDIVLGYSNIDSYLKSTRGYYGAIVGRVANRIANAKFTLEGKEYTLPINNPPNVVHGGLDSFSNVIWEGKQIDERTLQLTYVSPDGDQGFPGQLESTVVYQLTDDGRNTLQISYHASTDKDTIVNLTNHSFFNLSGAGSPTIEDHILAFNADKYTPTNDTNIPTGEVADVAGTPFDFTTERPIGSRINEEHPQIKKSNGYDHNIVLKTPLGLDNWAMKVRSPVTGIAMEIRTTEPGIQFYSGNNLKLTGKENKSYGPRSAFTAQTQHFPDSIHHSNFPSTVLKVGEHYNSTTLFSFSVVV